MVYNFQKYLFILKFDYKNFYVILDILYNIMIMMNSIYFGDFFFNDFMKILIQWII